MSAEEVLDQLLRPEPRPRPWRWVAAAIVAVVLAGYWWTTRPNSAPPVELQLPMASAPAVTTAAAVDEVVVHVAGAVAAPGVLTLSVDDRVADAIRAAGGPTESADLNRLNLAAPLVDGGRVFVPTHGEPVPGVVGPHSGSGAAADTPVNINVASAEELEQLTGIGPATAAAIVEHRDEHGPFATLDGLTAVRGIGTAKLDALRDDATVG